jgi:hypothetical protein
LKMFEASGSGTASVSLSHDLIVACLVSSSAYISFLTLAIVPARPHQVDVDLPSCTLFIFILSKKRADL